MESANSLVCEQSGPGGTFRQCTQRIRSAARRPHRARHFSRLTPRIHQHALNGRRLGGAQSAGSVVGQITNVRWSPNLKSGRAQVGNDPHDGHHFGLLHRVDAQIGFVVVQVQLSAL